MNRNAKILVGIITAFAVINRLHPSYITSMLFYLGVTLVIAELFFISFTIIASRLLGSVSSDMIVKGDTIEYRLLLENNTPFLFCPMTLVYVSEKLVTTRSTTHNHHPLHLNPYSKTEVMHTLQCNYRGQYIIGVDYIIVTGFFKLFSFRYTGMTTKNITVYPIIHQIRGLRLNDASATENGNTKSSVYQHHRDFSDIRAYQSGDPINLIHWKLTARHQQFVSKNYKDNACKRVKLLINNDAFGLTTEDKVILEDYLIHGAVAFSKHLLLHHYSLEILMEGYHSKRILGTQPTAFSGIYEQLAKIRFEKSTVSFQQSLKLATKMHHNQSVLVILTALLTPEIRETCLSLTSLGHELIIVTLPPQLKDSLFPHHTISDKQSLQLKANAIATFYLQYENNNCRLEAI